MVSCLSWSKLVFSTLILSIITSILDPPSVSADNVSKLGAVLAQTGPLAIQGVPMRNAMILAKEQLDPENRVQIIFEDDSFQPLKTVNAASKLINGEHVQAVAVFGTNQGMAVAGIIEQAGLPFLSINVNRKVITGHKNAYLLMPSVEALMKGTIKEIKRRGYKSIAIVAAIQDSTLLQRDILVGANVAKITANEELDPAEGEGRAVALRLMDKKPDAIFLSLLPPQGSMMAKRLPELGYTGDFFGGPQLADRKEFIASDGALLGAWVVFGDDRGAEKFYADYRARFKDEATAESIYAYDAFRLFLESTRHDDIIESLKNIKTLKGLSGESQLGTDNVFQRPVVAKEFTVDGFHHIN